MALNHDSLSPANQCQANRIVTTSNELDLLFSPMFDELLNGSYKVVSKSSTVSAADATNQRQQLTTPLNNHTTPAPTCQVPTLAPTVISLENINQAETHAKNDQVANDEFINIFSTPVQDQGEMSSHHVAICHETSVARSLQQNGVVERRNRTLIEAAHTISGPVLHEMTLATISSGLVQKSSSSTPFVPSSRNDWDLLFQPMFDELLQPQQVLIIKLLKLLLRLLK
nr:hypothetical protein [Tanacetum cinerariifolium]